MNESVRIDQEERFSRFSLISWWDQDRLQNAKVVVVGAGALGNEILKNLALLGIGLIAVVDFDMVERSNLSRAVLFREGDLGKPKSAAAAAALHGMHPGGRTFAVRGDIVHGVGLGLLRWADIVLGAVDNREARLAISRGCSLVDRPWIDGGIEVLSGVVRVFLPGDGPCYECTLSEDDWKILENRRACTLLPQPGVEEPRVPTTPTTASIIAGVQCAEAVKILHGIPGLAGEGFQFDGRGYDSYRVRYVRNPECYGHENLPAIQAVSFSAADTTVGRLTAEFEKLLGPGAIVESTRELVAGFRCVACETENRRMGALDSFSAGDAACPRCGRPGTPILYHQLAERYCESTRTLAELGIPKWDILRGRLGDREIGLELDGDRDFVLHGESR